MCLDRMYSVQCLDRIEKSQCNHHCPTTVFPILKQSTTPNILHNFRLDKILENRKIKNQKNSSSREIYFHRCIQAAATVIDDPLH